MDSILNGADPDVVSFLSLRGASHYLILRCPSQHLPEDLPLQSAAEETTSDQPRCFNDYVTDHLTKSLLHYTGMSSNLHSPLPSSAGNFNSDFFGSHSNYTYERTTSLHKHYPDQLASVADSGIAPSISSHFNNDLLHSAPRSVPSAPPERLVGTSYTATLWSLGSSSSFTGPSLSQTLNPSFLQLNFPPTLSQLKNNDDHTKSFSEAISRKFGGFQSRDELGSDSELADGDIFLQRLIHAADIPSTLAGNNLPDAISQNEFADADELLHDQDAFDNFISVLDNDLSVDLEFPHGHNIFTLLNEIEPPAGPSFEALLNAPIPRQARAASCSYHKVKISNSAHSSARIGHSPVWVTFYFPPRVFEAVAELFAANYSQDPRIRQPIELPSPFTSAYYALRRTTFLPIAECSKRAEYQIKPADRDHNPHYTSTSPFTVTPILQSKNKTKKKGDHMSTDQTEYEGLLTVKAHHQSYDTDAKTDRYYSRLNIYELSHILGLHNYKIKLTRDIEFNILEMFRCYCDFPIGFQTWVRGATKAERFKLIDRLATVVRPFYPEFSKFQLEIIVRRASYSMMQSRLRRRRRILHNITNQQR